MSVCLASVGAVSGPAWAQSGSPEQTGSDDTSAQAGADSDTIVVTARRREERLEDVPASLSYFDVACMSLDELWR
jgi:iron complex outermembrane receptor protein